MSKARCREGGKTRWESFIVSRQSGHRVGAILMLSFGKLMKMCGVFISHVKAFDRSLIAPFFCGSGFLSFRYRCSHRKKNHFHINHRPRSRPMMNFNIYEAIFFSIPPSTAMTSWPQVTNKYLRRSNMEQRATINWKPLETCAVDLNGASLNCTRSSITRSTIASPPLNLQRCFVPEGERCYKTL